MKYESKITASTCSAEQIYSVIADLRNIDRVKDLIPQDKVQEMECDTDFVRFKVDGLGQKIKIAIIDREPNKTIKFALQNMPMELTMWLQLKEVAEHDTRLKITMDAELPMMLKMMFEKKLQAGIDQAAEMLAKMPFNQWV